MFLFFITLLIGYLKGGEDMTALVLWMATKVLNEEYPFSAVPKRLKPAVRQLLEEQGHGDLAKEN